LYRSKIVGNHGRSYFHVIFQQSQIFVLILFTYF